MRRQLRGDGDFAPLRQVQPGEAERQRLPHAARRRRMDALMGVAAHILDVDQRRAHEVRIRLLRHAQPRGQPGMDGRPQRRAVGVIGARAVVIPVDAQRFPREVLRQKRKEQQHIRLLEHLMRVGALDAQQRLHRLRAVGEGRPVDFLETEKALELFDQAGVRVLEQHQVVGDVAPARQPLLG